MYCSKKKGIAALIFFGGAHCSRKNLPLRNTTDTKQKPPNLFCVYARCMRPREAKAKRCPRPQLDNKP